MPKVNMPSSQQVSSSISCNSISFKRIFTTLISYTLRYISAQEVHGNLHSCCQVLFRNSLNLYVDGDRFFFSLGLLKRPSGKQRVLRGHAVQNVVIAKIHVLNSSSSHKQQLGSGEIWIRPRQRPVVTCKITVRREGHGRVLFLREYDCIALIFRASRVPYASGPFLESPDN